MNDLYIGLMSGTSMDGVDAVLIRMNGTQWGGALAHEFLPFKADLRERLLDLQNVGENELHRSQMLALELSELYAQVVANLLKNNHLNSDAIVALGCHGQTVRHAPECGYSIQLANLSYLAEKTGILTVGDFRNRDMAAGGQGAPLVPAFHQYLFENKDEIRVVLNIGGIANISVLPKNGVPFGFDTGVGNMLMDAWVQYIWQENYDANGEKSQQGNILPDLLKSLCSHEYFSLPYPKSTGRELFSLAWLQSYLQGNENPFDVLRTLVEFTVETIVMGILQVARETKGVYVCGGGTENAFLMQRLKDILNQNDIFLHSTETLNLNPQWVEAAAFAWLAACWVHRLPSNPHHATGANRPVVLGAGYLS